MIAQPDQNPTASAEEAIPARLLSKAGHEVAQPLHALGLYLSALERRLDGEALDILGKAQAATVSLGARLEALFEFARVRHTARGERQVLALEPLLGPLLQNAPALARRGEPWSGALCADPVLLELLLARLIRFCADELTDAELCLRPQQEFLDIVFKGRWVAQRELETLFEAFVGDGGRGDGLGLSLPIAKTAADRMGMSLRAALDGEASLELMLRAPLGSP